jgi:hypothetical protein
MLPLNPGEQIVKQGNVVRQTPQGARPGELTLTNHRLLFEVHLPQGSGDAVVRVTVNAPLGRIRTVSTPGGTSFQVELPMQVGVFESPEAAAWVPAITEARSHAPPAPPGPGGGGPGGPGARGGPMGRGGPRGPGGGGLAGGAGTPPPPPPPPPAATRSCAYCGFANVPAGTKCPRCSAPG